MEIISVKITSVFETGAGKAKANAVLGRFGVRGIKVCEGKSGLFVAMPSYKSAKGKYIDIFFPMDKEAKEELAGAVLRAYAEKQAENAAANGVEVLLDCKVTGMEIKDGKIQTVNTTKGDISAKWVVNCAGLYCDDIAKMAGECDFTVHPRKGQFFVLSKDTPVKVSHTILSVPTKNSRGTLVIPTVDGNILVGPTAEDLEDKTDKKTTKEGLDFVTKNALALVPGLHMEDTITQFVGLRPAREPEGYNILVSEKVKGYVGISGIRSSGLTVSLGIAKYTIHQMQKAGLELTRKNGFIKRREGIVSFADKSDEEKARLIEKDPLYGKIICRCEQITESEILQAIHRPVGARTVDAVKRRVRAGMGRCQGGFCSPLVIEILARELNVSPEEIRKRGGVSYMLEK